VKYYKLSWVFVLFIIFALIGIIVVDSAYAKVVCVAILLLSGIGLYVGRRELRTAFDRGPYLPPREMGDDIEGI